LLLPGAFRSLPRPSSPGSSKASTVDPCSLDHITSSPFSGAWAPSSGAPRFFKDPVEVWGFEPQTYGLQSHRSGQLSYTPRDRLLLMCLFQSNEQKAKGGEGRCAIAPVKDERRSLSLRKEVIQPHLPVRLPCYDFTPLTRHTFGTAPLCRSGQRLRVPPTRVV
jgi:hypothetical protein